jgi:hypothetical protein
MKIRKVISEKFSISRIIWWIISTDLELEGT